jgi:hypothetical protein
MLVALPIAFGVLGYLGYSRIQSATEAAANMPPAGTIWFGSSFDPSTLEIRARTATIDAGTAFSAVAHLTREMTGTDFTIRESLDGQLIASGAFGRQGTGDVWGFNPGLLFQGGRLDDRARR